jgi:hypothetical protein
MNPEADTSPSAPSTLSAPGSPRFDVEELGKKNARWRLELRPGDLALFEGDDPQPFVLLRERLLKDVMFAEGMRALALNKPRKLTFKLTPEAARAVADWIGKPTLATFHLKRRYGWVLPVAIIWVIGALPMSGHPEAGIEPKPLDAVGLGLGLVLVVAWAFARWRPHPVLFLVDSIWFLWLAGYLIHDVANGRSKAWLVLVAMMLWMVVTGLKHFARFRGIRVAPRTP